MSVPDHPAEGGSGRAETPPWRRWAGHLIILAVVLGVWEMTGVLGLVDQLILPRPSSIIASWWSITIVQGLVHKHFGITLTEAFAGFFFGVTSGILLAVASALSVPFRRYSNPYVVALQVTPRIALAPIIIGWFGFGLSGKMVVAGVICFFAPFINTLTGLLNTDKDSLEMFDSLRASKRQIFWRLQLPNAMPVIMAGLKTALTLALIGTIVGEFMSANAGMGLLMQRFTFALNMSASFAVLLTLTLMGLLLFGLMEALDSRLVYWKHDSRMKAISERQKRDNAKFLEAALRNGQRRVAPAAQPAGAPAE